MKSVSKNMRLLMVIVAFSSFLFAWGHVGAINQAQTPATKLIGQPDFETNMSALHGKWNPQAFLQVGTKIFVSEACRVTVYNTAPTTNYEAPDYAFGTPNSNVQCSYTSATSKSMYDMRGLATDGTRLFASDMTYNRILIYNTVPAVNDAAANVVLGQSDMSTGTENTGGLSASSLSSPRGITIADGKLFVADRGNNRVLIWNTLPINNNQAADVVLGQPNFTSNTANNGGVSAHSLYRPNGVVVIGGKLYVTDYSNNRVLVFNTIPTSNQTDADVVLGQPNMTSNTANNGGISTHSLSGPIMVTPAGAGVAIVDTVNHRVLVFNSIPTVNQADADVVVGQPNMTSNTANNGGVSGATLNTPIAAQVIDSKLYIADMSNSRVLIWNTVPAVNGATANLVLGQTSFTGTTYSFGGFDRFSKYLKIETYGNKFFAVDSDNHRVLIWNSIPNMSDTISPDVVLGQPSLNSAVANYGGLSGSSFYYPRDVAVCNDKMAVVDYLNHRVLIWNSIPTTTNQVADVVLGQPNFTSNTGNNGGRSAHSLFYPAALGCIGDTLLVADLWNHRVLVFNTFPTTNQVDANTVLGQPDFTSGTENNGGVSAHSLSMPFGVQAEGTKLAVADYGNNRVLIYNTMPVANQADADIALGQPNLTSNTANNGGIGASTMRSPMGAYSDGTRFMVSDTENHRILGWASFPTSTGQAADFVLGQTDFASTETNITATTLLKPMDILKTQGYLYVADSGNARILIYPAGPQNTSINANSAVVVPSVPVSLVADDAKEFMISEDSGFSGVSWETFSPSKTVSVSGAEGTKTIYVKYRDFANFEGSVLSATTVLDSTGPTGAITVNSGAAATNNRATTLTLAGTDSLTSVTHMKISESASFTGASWESYATSKAFTVSTGDGTKTVYVKFKDAAGNESLVYSDTIVLDTVKPTINITNLGLISGVPDQASLYYYFTSRTPYIQGETEAGSTVYFTYGGNNFTTTANGSGWYGLTIATLPIGYTELTYYAVDPAGNTSSERTLKLMIQTENSVDSLETTPADTVEVTPTAPMGEDPVRTELFTITVADEKGNSLANASVSINSQQYVTDAKGNIYVEQRLSSDMTIKVTVDGRTVDGEVRGDRIIAAVSDSTNKTGYAWWWVLLAALVGASWLVVRKSKKTTTKTLG